MKIQNINLMPKYEKSSSPLAKVGELFAEAPGRSRIRVARIARPDSRLSQITEVFSHKTLEVSDSRLIFFLYDV
jgi:hypothetical protein